MTNRNRSNCKLNQLQVGLMTLNCRSSTCAYLTALGSTARWSYFTARCGATLPPAGAKLTACWSLERAVKCNFTARRSRKNKHVKKKRGRQALQQTEFRIVCSPYEIVRLNISLTLHLYCKSTRERVVNSCI
jgi:hypothetical protein